MLSRSKHNAAEPKPTVPEPCDLHIGAIRRAKIRIVGVVSLKNSDAWVFFEIRCDQGGPIPLKPLPK